MPSPTLALKPTLPALQTPPSPGPRLTYELPRSPLPSASLPVIKAEDVQKTPITPPTAYTDFLKALSPAVSTPLTAASARSAWSFTDKTGHLTPISQPSSASSFASSTTDGAAADKIKTTVVSAPLCPPTPFVRPSPTAARVARTPTTLRKLRIPPSPGIVPATPDGAKTATTPRPASAQDVPLSAVRSPYSPTSWYIDGQTKMFGAPLSASPRHVSVRQVVTRTVTYRATPLEPAPRGKRRRLE